MTSIISISEFGSLLRRCLPPITNSISIAHSGGPDSTCLLYLINAWLKTQVVPPFSIISLTVDHQLQPTSAFVAKQASNYALSLGIPSYILTVPWSTPPYPRRPSNEEAFETVARQARYDIMQSEMSKHGSSVLAMGHHADDNVETLLMRMNNRGVHSGENNTLSTLKPIRPRRRVGMSNADKLSGMHQWIIRPLLSVSKSRILETSERCKLPYTLDQTNFQPAITPRNFVRQCLRMRSETREKILVDSPAKSSFTVDSVNKSISMLEAIAGSSTCAGPLPTRLYSATEYTWRYLDKIDNQVTTFLEKSARLSPLSTLSIPCSISKTELEISSHIVRRILRYVSPNPWGHPSAEAFGSSINIAQISSLLWSSEETKRPFTLGSQVIWRPFKFKEGHHRQKTSYWIASRQPPILRNKAINPCIADVTHLFKTHPEGFYYLWDHRFLVIIRPAVAPSYVQALLTSHDDGQVVITPHSKWFLPRVEFKYSSDKGRESIVLGQCSDAPVTPVSLQQHMSFYTPDWIRFQFMRVLEPI